MVYFELLTIGNEVSGFFICRNIFPENLTILSFIVMAVIISVIFNSVFLLFFSRTNEFKYLYGMFKERYLQWQANGVNKK